MGCRRQGDGDDTGTEEQSQPNTVHALTDGGREITRADAAGDRRCCGVGEEDKDADGGHQQGRGDTETGELGRAQMADDGGVGHEEEGLGDEGAEGRHGECDDLSVVLSPAYFEGAQGPVSCAPI